MGNVGDRMTVSAKICDIGDKQFFVVRLYGYCDVVQRPILYILNEAWGFCSELDIATERRDVYYPTLQDWKDYVCGIPNAWVQYHLFRKDNVWN